MFETLGDRLQNALHKIKGYGKITEDNISDMMREIRLALLEADVNYKVVKEFTNIVKEKALGEEVASSINPGDLFVKIVKDELTELLGGESKPLNTDGNPAILMLVGLQGSGKTTSAGKLANYLRKKELSLIWLACQVFAATLFYCVPHLLSLSYSITCLFAEWAATRRIQKRHLQGTVFIVNFIIFWTCLFWPICPSCNMPEREGCHSHARFHRQHPPANQGQLQ